jgi:hypothetical protein
MKLSYKVNQGDWNYHIFPEAASDPGNSLGPPQWTVPGAMSLFPSPMETASQTASNSVLVEVFAVSSMSVPKQHPVSRKLEHPARSPRTLPGHQEWYQNLRFCACALSWISRGRQPGSSLSQSECWCVVCHDCYMNSRTHIIWADC